MKTTVKQDESFGGELKDRIEFLGQDFSWVLDWVAKNFDSDDVFSSEVLAQWASENGYINESMI